jgi:GMP synthase (glutamine-hydrolysing)
MGGTASIYESLDENWFREEKIFLERCLNRNRKILGICLGSQLLANILGSRVYPAKKKEIGWFPVTFRNHTDPAWRFLPSELVTFHWHGDTFDLPGGAVHLASSEITPNQGFLYGDQILALQFHPEMTMDSLEKIVRVAGAELLNGGDFVQSADQILSEKSRIPENNALMYKILDHFTGTQQ